MYRDDGLERLLLLAGVALAALLFFIAFGSVVGRLTQAIDKELPCNRHLVSLPLSFSPSSEVCSSRSIRLSQDPNWFLEQPTKPTK